MLVKDKIDIVKIRNKISSDGFVVLNNIVSPDLIKTLRSNWLDHIKTNKSNSRFVRGNLVFGEDNFLSYSKISKWCMYRNFDFLWNKPTDQKSTELCVYFHKLRNKIQGIDENYGISYNSENYGIYISTSLYKPEEGMLEFHSDGHTDDDTPILHYMIPLSFKGKDYSDGGLCVYSKNGIKHNVDDMCSPGSIIFFDGRNKHGVDLIEGKSVGRLAIFAVPTFFEKEWKLKVQKRKLTNVIKEFFYGWQPRKS